VVLKGDQFSSVAVRSAVLCLDVVKLWLAVVVESQIPRPPSRTGRVVSLQMGARDSAVSSKRARRKCSARAVSIGAKAVLMFGITHWR
jgi:hypothetical protein